MDTQNDFYDWHQIVTNTQNHESDIFPKEYTENSDEPCMYSIILNDNKEICDDLIMYILQTFLQFKEKELTSGFQKLRQDTYIICGPYTREIAEIKTLNVINFAAHNQQNIECTICKDYQNAVKKS